jgi:hypothetical protein
MNVKEIEWEYVDWIHEDQDRDKFHTLRGI